MGPERRGRARPAQPLLAAPVEGGQDGDGGVAGTVESQRLPVTRVSGVTGDDPGQVVCHTEGTGQAVNASGNMQRQQKKRDSPLILHMQFTLLGTVRFGCET